MDLVILTVGGRATGPSVRARALRRVGYRVTEAANREDALHLALEIKPDLIVLSGSAGTTNPVTCHQFRADPATAKIPIISISSSRARRRGSHDLYADICLPPTVTPRVLVSAIRLLLRVKAAERKCEVAATDANDRALRDLEQIQGLLQLKRELEARVEELTRENARLMAPSEGRQKSTPAVAHDLLSPLCTISFVSTWIFGEYGERLGVTGRESMSLLLKSVERMIAAVDRLFSLPVKPW